MFKAHVANKKLEKLYTVNTKAHVANIKLEELYKYYADIIS